MTNLLTSSHIQKYIAVGVMAVAMFFGMFAFANPANAQMAPEDMQAEIDRLTTLLEQLTSTIGNTPSQYPQPEPTPDDDLCYNDDRAYEAGARVNALTVDGSSYSGVYVCIDRDWEQLPEVEGGENDPYNMSDVKKIRSRYFNPVLGGQRGDEYRRYRISLNDGTVHTFRIAVGTTGVSPTKLENKVRATGFTGKMANFNEAVKNLIPVRNTPYYMGQVERVTSKELSTGATRYVVTLTSGTQHTVLRMPTMTNKEFERALRNTGFAGNMKNFNAAVDTMNPIIDTPTPYPGEYPVEEDDSEGSEEVCDPTYCDEFPLSPTPAPAPESDPEAPGSTEVCDPTYCDTFPTSPDSGTSGTSGGPGSAGGSSYPGATGTTGSTGGSGTSGSTGGTAPSDTAVEKFYAKAILVVNRRDFYTDDAQTQLSYRRYAIKKTDGTTVVVKRKAGVGATKFTEQLRAAGYYGTLENFQAKVVKLTPRVLGAATSTDSYARWSYSIDDLELSLRAFLAPQVLGASTSRDSYSEWSDSIDGLERAVQAFIK